MAASTASGTPGKAGNGNAQRPRSGAGKGPRKPRAAADPAPPDGLTAGDVGELQAAAEKAPPPRPAVTFMGKEFRLSDGIPEMALMKFAVLAESGTDSKSMAGRTAMHSLLRFAIYGGEPCTCEFRDGEGADFEAGLLWHTAKCTWTLGDWPAFEKHAMDTYAGHNDFLNLVVEIVERAAGRPTSPPSGSSPTDGGTSPNSKERSSSDPAAGTSAGQADGLTGVGDLL